MKHVYYPEPKYQLPVLDYFILDEIINGKLHKTEISIYKNILVFWYEYDDTRILEAIDKILKETRHLTFNRLVAVHYRKGFINLLWETDNIPSPFEEGNSFEIIQDCWSIAKSCSYNTLKKESLEYGENRQSFSRV